MPNRIPDVLVYNLHNSVYISCAMGNQLIKEDNKSEKGKKRGKCAKATVNDSFSNLNLLDFGFL